jgi:zinc protease
MRKFLILIALAAVALAVEFRQDTLPNGLLVLSVEAHKIPEILIQAVVRAGSSFDPAGQEGLANLTNQMLIRGTKSHSGDALAEAIEDVGGDISPFCDEDHAGLSGRALAPDLELLVRLMKECLIEPAFDSSALLPLKRQIMSNIRAADDDPFEVGSREFRALVFGANPYNHDPAGFDSTVASITIPALRGFYRDYYGPSQTFLVCVGDFNHDKLLDLLREEFQDWPAVEPRIPAFTKPKPPEQPIGKIVKRDISQAYIILGYSGPNLRAQDWNATRLMNYILGGSGLTSRIMHRIREEQGLAYDARSSFYRYLDAGLFLASVQTKKEMAGQAIRSLIGEIGRIKDDVTPGEIALAKDYYIGHFPLTYDTYSELADIAVQIQIERLGFDYLDRYEKIVNGLTIDQVRASAQKYLHPEAFYLVIVGDVKPDDIKVEGIRWLE